MCVTSNLMTSALPRTIFPAHKVGIHLDHPFHTWFAAAVVPARTQAGPVIYPPAFFDVHVFHVFQAQLGQSQGLRVLLADTTCGFETHATRVTNNLGRTEGLVFQFMASASKWGFP